MYIHEQQQVSKFLSDDALQMEACASQCVLESNLANANVALFHAPTSPLLSLPKNKYQPWILVSQESHLYYAHQADTEYVSKFEHFSNYSFDSVLPLPYQCPTLRELQQIPPSNKMKHGIAMFVSNCEKADAKQRYEYLRELMNHVPIDSFGACLHNKDVDAAFTNDGPASYHAKHLTMQNYKFGIAFENAQLKDYVTEKIFNVLHAGIIPIYWGAPNIDDFVPPHSFINANLLSPLELSALILEVSQDDAKFNAYFAWKQTSAPIHVETQFYASNAIGCNIHMSMVCKVCQWIHKQDN